MLATSLMDPAHLRLPLGGSPAARAAARTGASLARHPLRSASGTCGGECVEDPAGGPAFCRGAFFCGAEQGCRRLAGMPSLGRSPPSSALRPLSAVSGWLEARQSLSLGRPQTGRAYSSPWESRSPSGCWIGLTCNSGMIHRNALRRRSTCAADPAPFAGNEIAERRAYSLQEMRAAPGLTGPLMRGGSR